MKKTPTIVTNNVFLLPYLSEKAPINGDATNCKKEYNDPNAPPNNTISHFGFDPPPPIIFLNNCTCLKTQLNNVLYEKIYKYMYDMKYEKTKIKKNKNTIPHHLVL